MFASIFVLFAFVGYLVVPLTVLVLLLIPTIPTSQSPKTELQWRALRELKGLRNENEKKWNMTVEEAESSGLSSSDEDDNNEDDSISMQGDIDGDDEPTGLMRRRKWRNGKPLFERSDIDTEVL